MKFFMIDSLTIEFKQIPLDQLVDDPRQPRESFNTDGDKNRLKLSLQELGIQQPVAVMELKDGRYQIIDGHRRAKCARELEMVKLPCCIYHNLTPGDLERVRYELQNNRRLWKPLERASALTNFKSSSGINTNKEAAEKLFISETLVSNSLQLGALKAEYKDLMEKYGLSPSYQVEFVKLRPKLRPIKDFSVDDIIKSLFERVSHQVIRTSKDFRTLGRIFLRATANHKQIHSFLMDPDMTIAQLEERTIQSGFSLWLEQSIEKIRANEKEGAQFSSHEKVLLTELRKQLDKVLTKQSDTELVEDKTSV
ncbi:MAG: ParB/RepB/Spo0J family partition protein [Candidatus Kerfeldbacteria bacterium]|nr:ParB/RepB/Spo0J family partition protein [Candidatus Kerfeldbacteria bacterium]